MLQYLEYFLLCRLYLHWDQGRHPPLVQVLQFSPVVLDPQVRQADLVLPYHLSPQDLQRYP